MENLFDREPARLDNGIVGEIISIASGNPVNFFQALSEPTTIQPHGIYGQLFLPEGENLSLVIVVPGSLGVAASHLTHCDSLTSEGIAALAIDPFGTRQVTSTVANQAQYSFAASSWDVLAAARTIRGHDKINVDRIGAQGHSRGGTAVVNAAVTAFAAAMKVAPLHAVYAAYPWCGFQFLTPSVGSTVVRSIIGDQDEWCLAQQVQSYMHAMTLAGGSASCRIVNGAHHSFDRGTAIELVKDASVAPSAPTTYLDDDGCYIHPIDGKLDSDATDRDLMVYGVKSGYGRRGARIGSSPGEAEVFKQDMLDFWRSNLA